MQNQWGFSPRGVFPRERFFRSLLEFSKNLHKYFLHLHDNPVLASPLRFARPAREYSQEVPLASEALVVACNSVCNSVLPCVSQLRSNLHHHRSWHTGRKLYSSPCH